MASCSDLNPLSHASPVAVEEVLVKIPFAILHTIEGHDSVEVVSGDFSIARLSENVVAMFATVDDEIQWPLIKDEAVVKLDESDYFFSRRPPEKGDSDSESSDEEEEGRRNDHGSESLLNYVLMIPSKEEEKSSKELDRILDQFSSFTVQNGSYKAKKGGVSLNEVIAAGYVKSWKMKKLMEGKCAAYWTKLAPNVEDCSGTAAKLIAAGSGHVIKGILWSGDVTAEILKWGNEAMKKKMSHSSEVQINPQTMEIIKWVKLMMSFTEAAANGMRLAFICFSGKLTSSVANSKVGKKFFGLFPGEILLASLDGSSSVWDAVEVAVYYVMSTSATVITDFVSHRYGEEAGRATNEGLDAAGHAIETAWAFVEIPMALHPKTVLNFCSLAKSAVKGSKLGLLT